MVLGMTNKPEQDRPDKLSPSQAAQMLHVSTRTLTRMADSGKVAVIKLPSGHRRYMLEDIEAMLPEKARSGATSERAVA